MPRYLLYALRYVPLLLLAIILVLAQRQRVPAQLTTENSLSGMSPEGSTLYGLALPSSQEGWAVGGSFNVKTDEHGIRHQVPGHGTILHYLNGNWSVQTVMPQPVFAVSMASLNDGWAVGDAGLLAHYSGGTWQQIHPPTNANLRGIVLLSIHSGWAVGTGGVILRLQDQRWTTVVSPTQEDLFSISMVSPQEGWAVGTRGTLLHYVQGTWQVVNNLTNNTLRAVTMLSPREGWAVGEHGTILHYRDGLWNSVSWFAAPDAGDTEATLYAVTMASERIGWIMSSNFFLSYDKEVWQAHPYSAALLDAVVMNSPQEGWAVGSNNSIYHYRAGQWQIYVE